MTSAPCAPWTTPEALPCAGVGADVAVRAIDAATFVLWSLGGRRHGECLAAVRPCAPRAVPDLSWHQFGTPWQPVLSGGEWLNVCGHATDCGCSSVSEVVLPVGPVGSIDSVIVDGVELVEGVDYRLDDGRRLVRLGGASWPACQDMTAQEGEPGTFVVRFRYGVPVDALARMAVEELACEFAKAIGGGPCRLPQRVTSLTRQGVSMTLLDPQDFLADGRTGFYLADLWLAAVNPASQRSASAVYSVDRPRPRLSSGPVPS